MVLELLLQKAPLKLSQKGVSLGPALSFRDLFPRAHRRAGGVPVKLLEPLNHGMGYGLNSTFPLELGSLEFSSCCFQSNLKI